MIQLKGKWYSPLQTYKAILNKDILKQLITDYGNADGDDYSSVTKYINKVIDIYCFDDSFGNSMNVDKDYFICEENNTPLKTPMFTIIKQ